MQIKKNIWRIFLIFLMNLCMVFAQEKAIDQKIHKSIEQYNAMLESFSSKCERRTKKAEQRFGRYERKMNTGRQDSLRFYDIQNGTGKEPLLDSLKLVYGFADYTGLSASDKSLNCAQQQLNITQRTKNKLYEHKEYYKAQVKEHPEYDKWLDKMEKERYYYSAQINEYRKTLRDPSNLDDKLMIGLRSDPRFKDFLATLTAKSQNPEKMQPRRLVQQLMQSQAAVIDPEAAKLLRDAQSKGNDLLGNLSNQTASFGNMDNAAQIPNFTPNPYKTKSLWQRIDVGFILQFDNRTLFLPSTGVAGAQVSFNFDPKFNVGALANFRFDMGEIKNIQFSHVGAGYGAFANYKVLKALGLQAGYERNQRAEMEMNENRYPVAWTSSVLAGLTWEYGIGKKAKASVGVFYDFLHKQHTPVTNAILWRMGWKM